MLAPLRAVGETVHPSGIIIPDLRDAIARARRSPAHCLYCREEPGSREHPIPEALGGRLWARIACQRHNQLAGRAADEGLIEELRSCVHLLGVKRQRGRGSAMYGVADDGERIKFTPQGRPVRRRLEVLDKTPSRKILRARGALATLDSLKARGALADQNGRVIAYVEKAPPITISTHIGSDAEKAALKIALHFVAGFVTDVDLEVSNELWPYITGDKIAGGRYVRTLTLEGRFFPSSWPPKHVVAVYPAGEQTFVTVLLFGLYGFNVLLPIAAPAALRYVQNLVDDVRPILEPNDHIRDFEWDDRMTDADMEAMRINLQWRHDYFMDVGAYRILREQCKRAHVRAVRMSLSTGLDIHTTYKAQLQLEGFSANQIIILMHYALVASQTGKQMWDIPFEIIRQ